MSYDPRPVRRQQRGPKGELHFLQGAGITSLLSPTRWHGYRRKWIRGRIPILAENCHPGARREKPKRLDPFYLRKGRRHRLRELRTWLHRKLRGLHVPVLP